MLPSWGNRDKRCNQHHDKHQAECKSPRWTEPSRIGKPCCNNKSNNAREKEGLWQGQGCRCAAQIFLCFLNVFMRTKAECFIIAFFGGFSSFFGHKCFSGKSALYSFCPEALVSHKEYKFSAHSSCYES